MSFNRDAYNKEYYRNHKQKIRQGQTLSRVQKRLGKEESRKVAFSMRLPESIASQLQRMAFEGLATGKYPWKHPSEVARGLIIRGLQSLKGDETIDSALPEIEMQENLEGMQRAQRTAYTMLSKARTTIDSLLAIKADREALQYYHSTMTFAKGLPPTVWSEWLMTQMLDSYPELSKRDAPGIRLMGKKKDKEKRTRR